MSFKEQYMPATKRKSITHLYDEKNPMKPLDFISFCETVKSKGYILSDKNSKFSEKIDGFGFRFGKDSHQNFFIESSNSGPIFSPGCFRNYSIQKHGSSNEITEAYEQLFDILSSDKKLNFVLDNYKDGIKVICECLFTSLGKKNNVKRKFVCIEYDEDKLGTVATFSIIKIEDAYGNELNCVDEILELSNNKIKIVSSYFKDFQIDFKKQVDEVLNIVDTKQILTNLKRDEESIRQRNELKERLLKIQKQMKDCVLEKFNVGMLGNEYEGFVLTVDDFVVKFVTEHFTNGKK